MEEIETMMINRTDRFELSAGDHFVLHRLNGGSKTLCTAPDGSRYTAEHRSKRPGRHIEADEVLVARQDVSTSGGTGKVFKAKFVNGPDAGEVVTVHTNHAWPFCPYLRAPKEEAQREARRQAAAVKGGVEARIQSKDVHDAMPIAFDENAPKRATNVSVNSDLLARAKGLGINLSQALEGRLAELVKERVREQWLEQNKEAIEAYNRRIEHSGVFGDDGRTF